MINQLQLARQTHNIELSTKIEAIKQDISETVQLHLFEMSKGRSIKVVESRLNGLRRRLL
jgi:hypothetical protein